MSLENPTIQEELAFDAVKQAGPGPYQRFIDMLTTGESISMAAMLATQHAPSLGINDSTYFRNQRGNWADQMTPEVAAAWNRQYRAETGEDIPGDAVIMRGLASHQGDSRVVLTHKNTLSDVKRVMKDRNLNVEGDWEIKAIPVPPTPQNIRMDRTLIEETKATYIKEDPSFAEMDQGELEDMIVENHTIKVGPNEIEQCRNKTFADITREVWERSNRRITIPAANGAGTIRDSTPSDLLITGGTRNSRANARRAGVGDTSGGTSRTNSSTNSST